MSGVKAIRLLYGLKERSLAGLGASRGDGDRFDRTKSGALPEYLSHRTPDRGSILGSLYVWLPASRSMSSEVRRSCSRIRSSPTAETLPLSPPARTPRPSVVTTVDR